MEDLRYVDVCLDSVNAEKEAWPIVQQLRPAWQVEETIIEVSLRDFYISFTNLDICL